MFMKRHVRSSHLPSEGVRTYMSMILDFQKLLITLDGRNSCDGWSLFSAVFDDTNVEERRFATCPLCHIEDCGNSFRWPNRDRMRLVERQKRWSNLTQSISWFFKESIVNNRRSYSISKGIHGNDAANVKEIEIPLPYGKIAGKAWGSETASPVLAFHGWLDNCGTFDRLIPLLSDQFYFVTIDAPGHGKSSHRPPGCLYTDMSMILDFKKAVDHLGWEKFHLMGHSLGGSFALLFSSIFPDLVDKVISLDTVKTFSLPADVVPVSKIKAVHRLLEIEKKLLNPPPIYTTESAPARLKKGMHDEITEEGAKILLKRGAMPSDCEKGLVFSRDLRCQPIEMISVESDEVIETFMTGLRCKLLMILANNTHPKYQPETPKSIAKFTAMYKQNLEHFVLEHVDGNHFVHLNNPERIAPFINNFLIND